MLGLSGWGFNVCQILTVVLNMKGYPKRDRRHVIEIITEYRLYEQPIQFKDNT